MSVQTNQLRKAVEKRKRVLINKLLKLKYFKSTDGKQLHELTLTDLEVIHINLQCERGRKMPMEEMV
ncbi:Fur-regulated basic protein FbpA [Metabacillus fastidiosus]|uniref:Fur-regulated basic protein FbpA n=1 Tax=Metabacillus fastidiosus TaxID=1458 RepID=UPI003D2B9A39